MANAAIQTGIAVGTDALGLAARKHNLAIQRLELCRDAIRSIDTTEKESWARIVGELIEGGFSSAELETELAASANTVYKWRSGLAAPREMTRRLLHRAVLEMVEDRLVAEAQPA